MTLPIIKNLIKKTPTDAFIGSIYYVNLGPRKGQSIVFINKNIEKAIYEGLAIPEMEVLEIPETSVINGKKANIIELI